MARSYENGIRLFCVDLVVVKYYFFLLDFMYNWES